jgi:hypothetical protein
MIEGAPPVREPGVRLSGWTVAKLSQNPTLLTRLGMQSERKQIPQVVENIESRRHAMELLEGQGVRPRQVRYQAALRPDIESP